MTAGRCHTLLSPVTEESGEEGTSSEVSSSPVCRSPSPITHTEVTITKVSTFSFPSDSLFMSRKICAFFLVYELFLFSIIFPETKHSQLINGIHKYRRQKQREVLIHIHSRKVIMTNNGFGVSYYYFCLYFYFCFCHLFYNYFFLIAESVV